jgi:hypothetical protein
MNYLIKDTTLTAIGDAVRAKGNTEDKILVSDLATAISNLPTGGGDIEVEPIELTGKQQYGCSGEISSEFIKLFGDKVSTRDLSDSDYMFYKFTLDKIPFELNFLNSTYRKISYIFNSSKIKEAPKINRIYLGDMNHLFSDCYYLRDISNLVGDGWDWSKQHTNVYMSCNNLFSGCFSLREIPQDFLKNLYGIQTNASYSPTNYVFNNCYTLDEVKNFPIQKASLTSNIFVSTLDNAHRLKGFTFAVNEDGTPKTASWKSQTIDLSKYVGYSTTTTSRITNYNSGITLDKRVSAFDTYEALKNDPDWWSDQISFSRYNHDSAVETINSLPDCSATGTNTIKFKGASGSSTDGGAINTLTEEEIAVAAAKGWTVTFV